MLIWLGGGIRVQATDEVEARIEEAKGKLLAKSNEISGQEGPCCGVYAACRALSLLGIGCNVQDFIQAKYIGNKAGSSPKEVQELLMKFPVETLPLSAMSRLDLWVTGVPIIANVKQSEGATAYDHWVCVLNSNSGITVFDGPFEGTVLSSEQFLRIWNGYGIMVCHQGDPISLVIWSSRIVVWSCCLAIGFGVWKWSTQFFCFILSKSAYSAIRAWH